MKPEVVYTTPFEPDLSRALDVLAFVLTPVEAFSSCPDEHEAIAAVLEPAKREAIARWHELQIPAAAIGDRREAWCIACGSPQPANAAGCLTCCERKS